MSAASQAIKALFFLSFFLCSRGACVSQPEPRGTVLKNTTRDIIVRQAGSNRISGGRMKDIQNSFSDSLLIEF